MDLKEKFQKLQDQFKVVRTDCEYATFAPLVDGVEVRKDVVTLTWDELVDRHRHRINNNLPASLLENNALRSMNSFRVRVPLYSTLEGLGLKI